MPKRLSQYGARDVFLAEKQVNASDLEQWKALDEAKRESYAAKAREIRENAALKYEEWYNSVDGKDLRKMNGMLAGAGLWKLFNPESENPESESKPPRPVLPFVRFFLELRSENPGIRIHDLSKVASAAWKELSSERKKEYTEAFQAEFKAWKENEALRKQEQEPRNKSKREKGQ
ncbi:hypothetical protein NP233_g1069 [Leucocoprinus birnbaumii]|uniref:HMG box domain-containing protein n=1 Tax=Leucocoprinus birnbaumii TaxID=56174 RepID=A0AAD5W121_9AGAR|nr:hypothetical protein NP233_g1069 [Leucocoprinus birnbaumii]